MNSSTVKPALRIKLRSVPFLSRRWFGTERLYRTPALVKMMWGPSSRIVHPARAKTCAARRPETSVGNFLGMKAGSRQLDLYLSDEHARAGVQLVAQILKIGCDRFADVHQCFFVSIPLGDTAGQGRDFDGVAALFSFAEGDDILDPFAFLTRHSLIIPLGTGRAKLRMQVSTRNRRKGGLRCGLPLCRGRKRKDEYRYLDGESNIEEG